MVKNNSAISLKCISLGVLLSAVWMSCAQVLAQGTASQKNAPVPICVVHEFNASQGGAYPESSPILGLDGNLYGTLRIINSSGSGAIYKITPDANETIFCYFPVAGHSSVAAGLSGTGPLDNNDLLQDSAGNMYGISYTSRSDGGGTGGGIFKVTPSGIGSLLYCFQGYPYVSPFDYHHPILTYPAFPDAASPNGLVLGKDGNLYGTSMGGGYGTYTWDGSPFDMTLGFDPNAHYPYPNLNIASGTVFKLSPAGVESVLYSFKGPSPVTPYANTADGVFPTYLIQGKDGNLDIALNRYFTNSRPEPAIFLQVTTGGQESFLSMNPSVPQLVNGSTMMQDAAGDFYVTSGGVYCHQYITDSDYVWQGNDFICKITAQGVDTVVNTLSPTEGFGLGPLIQTKGASPYKGNYFGLARYGGPYVGTHGNSYGPYPFYAYGSIYMIDQSGAVTILHYFSPASSDSPIINPEGSNPIGHLTEGKDGNLYGVASYGGKYSQGTVYKLMLNPPAGYQITDLGTLGGTSSEANGINEQGQIVGWASLASGQRHAFLWNPSQANATSGSMQDLGVLPEGGESAAFGINAKSQIVGSSYDADHNPRAFFWDNGSLTSAGTLGGGFSNGYAISSSGIIAGESENSSEDHHAFLMNLNNFVTTDVGFISGSTYSVCNGLGVDSAGQYLSVGEVDLKGGNTHAYKFSSYQDLGTLPGGVYSAASAVNAMGQTVGEADTSNGDIHACLWSDGSTYDLGALPCSYFSDSSAFAISCCGEIVGTSYTNDGYHAFVSCGSNMVDLNSRITSGSGWVLEGATGINCKEQIVGYGQLNGQEHAFLLTPILTGVF